jgi:hypothetical protein
MPLANPPDHMMLRTNMSCVIHPNFTSFEVSNRGVFKPWAVIRAPEAARAYRFVYPHLLIAARKQAFVYDVRVAELVLSVDETQTGNHDIRYVDFNDRYLFICFEDELHIFNRNGGQRVRALMLNEFTRNMPLHTLVSKSEPPTGQKTSVLVWDDVIPAPSEASVGSEVT